MIAPWKLDRIMYLKKRFREKYPREKVKKLVNVSLRASPRLVGTDKWSEIVAYYRAKITLETQIATIAIPDVLDLGPGSLYGIGCKKVYDKRYGYISHSMPTKREAMAGQGVLTDAVDDGGRVDSRKLDPGILHNGN